MADATVRTCEVCGHVMKPKDVDCRRCLELRWSAPKGATTDEKLERRNARGGRLPTLDDYDRW